MKFKEGYYWARPLRSVGAVVEGKLQIVEVSDCGEYVYTMGEEFSDPVSNFHFIKRITNPYPHF